MGKKKRLANRLTKMSDEERARYLQHKADMEEEIKRRKEQLISTFMKNKIKREENFARLNLAKINQYWHHLLRMDKVKEMKEEIEYLKKYMKRCLDYKNRTIRKLLEELTMAEEQYSHNFNKHMEHIDNNIVNHHDYLSHLWGQYSRNVDGIVDIITKENGDYFGRINETLLNLKTLIYNEESTTKQRLGQIKANFTKKKDDLNCTFRLKMESLMKQQMKQSTTIWKHIIEIVRSYIQQNDKRRLHLAELKRLNAEGGAEIELNQEKMKAQKVEIEVLRDDLRRLQQGCEKEVFPLMQTHKQLKDYLDKRRKRLRNDLIIDKHQLIVLTQNSNDILEFLLNTKQKCQHIYNLIQTNQQYETKNERLIKWLKLPQFIINKNNSNIDNGKKNINFDDNRPVLSSNIKTEIQRIVINEKSKKIESEQFLDDLTKFDSLMDLENFWLTYNKVELEVEQLKQEKLFLLDENKQIRGNLRALLQAEILQRSLTNSRVSTRVPSKVRSAPANRFVL